MAWQLFLEIGFLSLLGFAYYFYQKRKLIRNGPWDDLEELLILAQEEHSSNNLNFIKILEHTLESKDLSQLQKFMSQNKHHELSVEIQQFLSETANFHLF